MTKTKTKAIAFDFDGTLIEGGLDKGIHIMYSSWMACFHTGFRKYLNPDNPVVDVDTMLSAYLHYPGAPRFQQLAEIVNALGIKALNSSNDHSEFDVYKAPQKEYIRLKEFYNKVYSSLNSIAAVKYWKPFPSIKEVLHVLSQSYDLYIASGVTEEILRDDVDYHKFDRTQFSGIFGGNIKGGSDKGSILKRIKNLGYKDILFIGDSTKDLEYAIEANVKFFRIKTNNDYHRLLDEIKGEFPNEKKKWSFTQKEIDFFIEKTLFPLRSANRNMSLFRIVDYINNKI